jgi:bisphosphoglycerate-independent phosphoglycerate mutase (AlkP superfamily)
MTDGRKGDTPRPLGVTMEDFDKSWDEIFKKKDTSNVQVEVVADTDGQQINITKTWEF